MDFYPPTGEHGAAGQIPLGLVCRPKQQHGRPMPSSASRTGMEISHWNRRKWQNLFISYSCSRLWHRLCQWPTDSGIETCVWHVDVEGEFTCRTWLLVAVYQPALRWYGWYIGLQPDWAYVSKIKEGIEETGSKIVRHGAQAP
ncbi:hypothetical protein RJ035_007342 [Blastomyces gilchristii]